MKNWQRWVSAFAALGALAVLAPLALHQDIQSTGPEVQKLPRVPLSWPPSVADPLKTPVSLSGEAASDSSKTRVRAEPEMTTPAPSLPAPEDTLEVTPDTRHLTETVMGEIEMGFRSNPRAVRMDITTTRIQNEPIAGLPPYEELRLWGVVNGNPERTAILYAFFMSRRYRGTGLMIEDALGSREGDTMWYHMRTFRRFQHLPQASLRLLVAGTCMTYEDARGFLATDRYEFRFAESTTHQELRDPIVILARPLTPELESDTGYGSLEIRIDAEKRFVTEIRFTSLNGRPLKIYTAGDPVQLGDSWFPSVARIEDLQSSVVSVVNYRYWLLGTKPPHSLYDTTVEDLSLLERVTKALAQEGLEAESQEE